jgi:hypothetical protein
MRSRKAGAGPAWARRVRASPMRRRQSTPRGLPSKISGRIGQRSWCCSACAVPRRAVPLRPERKEIEPGQRRARKQRVRASRRIAAPCAAIASLARTARQRDLLGQPRNAQHDNAGAVARRLAHAGHRIQRALEQRGQHIGADRPLRLVAKEVRAGTARLWRTGTRSPAMATNSPAPCLSASSIAVAGLISVTWIKRTLAVGVQLLQHAVETLRMPRVDQHVEPHAAVPSRR